MNNLQNAGVTPRDRVNVLETRRDAKDTHEEATQENRESQGKRSQYIFSGEFENMLAWKVALHLSCSVSSSTNLIVLVALLLHKY